MKILEQMDVKSELARLPGWTGDTRALTREFTFSDFGAAMRFMQACAAGIDQRNHHPEWTNVYNRVKVRLSTHDAGDRVTELDVELARFLSERAKENGGK